MKDALVAPQNILESMALNITSKKWGTQISLSDLVVDKTMVDLKLSMVGMFKFKLFINMIRKWVSSHWKLKYSVATLTILGVVFLF